MGIIRPILVDAFKHLKIVYAQLKAPYVCANIVFFHLNLRANNPQNLLGYKLNIE
jgi:hypothetical protein